MTTEKKPHKHAEVIKAWADGSEIEWSFEGRDWHQMKASTPSFDEMLKYRIKQDPPAKVYPQTQLTGDQLALEWNKGSTANDGLLKVANAALRHALDNGQVTTFKEANDNALEHYNRAGQRNADRDIAIAQEVRDWYCNLFPGIRGALPQADLAEIISRVKS